MGCTGIYGSEGGRSTLAAVRHTQPMVHDPSSQINRKISDVCVCGGQHSKIHMGWSMAGKKKKEKKTMETLNISEPTNMPHPASENSSDRRAEAPLLRLWPAAH